MLAHLSFGETMFLGLVAVAFVAFGAALAYVNAQASRRPSP